MPLALMATTVRLNGSLKLPSILTRDIGPFRRTCEITLSLLRQNEDALMTVLETFLHDPTTDFIGKRVSKDSLLATFGSISNRFTSVAPM